MATYKEIQKYVKEKYGHTPKSCYIAHVKEMVGLPVKRAHNRIGEERKCPCPEGKVESIKEAFKYYKMI